MSANATAPVLRENKMGTMSVGKLLLNMALPLIISMLVQALYNVVDSVYVSRVSESAVTALSLAFPIQNLLIGFATGIGVGVNSLLSKSLGEGNHVRANQSAGNGFVLVSIVCLGFMVFGAFFSRPYYAMQSNVPETIEGGSTYISICCLLSLGIFVEVICERMLQGTGRSFYSMITQGTGAIINILLDPVFIFGYFGIPAMGITGAAVATVIGQWVAALLAVYFNLRHNPDIHLTAGYFRPHAEVLKSICSVGIPSIIMVGIGSVMNFGMNQILQGFNETATGVFGIYFKLQSFFLMPLFGLNNATISIVAYNYGARKPERIMGTVRLSVGIAFGFMLLGLAIFQLAPDLLMDFFNPSDSFLAMGRSALRIISLCFPMAAIGIALGSNFQALGNGIYSTITSLCRQLIVLLPVAYLLSLTGDVNNVWWSFPIAELFSLAATLIFFARIYRRKIKPLYLA